MLSTTDDLRISELKELTTPQEVMREIPRTLTATRIVMASRNAIHAILHGTDDRLLVVVGPCSVHDPAAAVEYAERLVALRAASTTLVAVSVRGTSRITCSGVLSSFNSRMRRSSVVLNTAVAPVRWEPAGQ